MAEGMGAGTRIEGSLLRQKHPPPRPFEMSSLPFLRAATYGHLFMRSSLLTNPEPQQTRHLANHREV
ncbi:hypothetical protein RRG08_006168 [Elysia crispata]|uniref:Uncharacterized protein n=1 Tax=Elysia crispata TaxID=231223 RepID=A0AAE1E680_9GAST|nr:hypothetical protein RRG08_006168 [Elysia crispata]